MIRDPLAYFLGLSASAEPHELLGLEAEETSAVKIETALRQRLAKLYQHRDGNLPEADSVRRRLRLAAKYLRTWPPRKPWPVWLREYASRAAASRPKEPDDLFQEERAAKLLGIPEGVSQVGLLPVAYTVGTEFKVARRPDPETITHWNGWEEGS